MLLAHAFIKTFEQLPDRVIVPTSDIGTFVGMSLALMGFAFLLWGIQVFRLVTTIQSILCGLLIGAALGMLIDSLPIGMLLAAVIAGFATWHYTRWVSALAVGLTAAALGWVATASSGINVIGTFFVAFAAAVIVGAPVLMFYRNVIMLYTSLSGAAMVVIGSAATIVLVRYRTLPSLHQVPTHAVVAGVCTLLLAIPSFFFQYTRYQTAEQLADSSGSADDAKPVRRREH
jgi:hypothetical protein